MGDTVAEAVAALNERLAGAGFAGAARLDIEGEGAIMVDAAGARAGGGAADVVLSADAGTFRSILEGGANPAAAFMAGRLKVDGDMGVAMELASALAR